MSDKAKYIRDIAIKEIKLLKEYLYDQKQSDIAIDNVKRAYAGERCNLIKRIINKLIK